MTRDGEQRLDDSSRQYGRPILLTFSTSDHNLPPVQIDVFDAELQAFLQPQSGAVQEGHHNPYDAIEMLHDSGNLFATQDNRYANRHTRAWDVLNRFDLDVESVAIEEQKCAERLICVEALTRRFVASQVRKAAISEAPISEGCRFR